MIIIFALHCPVYHFLAERHKCARFLNRTPTYGVRQHLAIACSIKALNSRVALKENNNPLPKFLIVSRLVVFFLFTVKLLIVFGSNLEQD